VDELAFASAAAVELIHCASLVHDDMPCFDDADMRRGKPSVHKAFGESTALLVGDGLIVAAFDVLARHGAGYPRFAELVRILARGTGASDGLVSGQAWEDALETTVDSVHRKKTGALFEAAAAMAAVISGVDEAPWRYIGQTIGAAYQIADDVMDRVGTPEIAGKPVRQDIGRPVANAVKAEGLENSFAKFHALVEHAIHAIPECPGRHSLAVLITGIAGRLLPAISAQDDTRQSSRTLADGQSDLLYEAG
jgi:geranylgeranyl diphosphate synthase type II